MSVGESFKMRGVAADIVLAVRFTVQVGGDESAEHIAFVEQAGEPRLGATGWLKIRSTSIAFGIPLNALESHIETYVVDAIDMCGGISVSDMANKVYEVEVQFPVEFQAIETGPETGQ
jgi:hypothetical protein